MLSSSLSPSLNLLLSMEMSWMSTCSWQAAPGCCAPGYTFMQCGYCFVPPGRGSAPCREEGAAWKRCSMRDGCIGWEAFESVPACLLVVEIWEQPG